MRLSNVTTIERAEALHFRHTHAYISKDKRMVMYVMHRKFDKNNVIVMQFQGITYAVLETDDPNEIKAYMKSKPVSKIKAPRRVAG